MEKSNAKTRIVDRLSAEIKAEIVKLYVDSPLTTKEICQSYNIGSSALNDIINEAGVPHRSPSLVGKTRNTSGKKKKYCRSCGSRLSPAGAKFCCECGKPLFTEKELIINQLEGLTTYFITLEHANRDKYISEVNAIIKAVKGLKIIDD